MDDQLQHDIWGRFDQYIARGQSARELAEIQDQDFQPTEFTGHRFNSVPMQTIAALDQDTTNPVFGIDWLVTAPLHAVESTNQTYSVVADALAWQHYAGQFPAIARVDAPTVTLADDQPGVVWNVTVDQPLNLVCRDRRVSSGFMVIEEDPRTDEQRCKDAALMRKLKDEMEAAQ